MYKFIKNNQKKMLAVFGVLLMVVFIIPPSAKSGSGRSRRAIGYVGKTPIYSDDRAQATSDWNLLMQHRVSLPFMTPLYANRFRPGTIPPATPLPAPYPFRLGLPLAAEIQANPELYFLLQKEAEHDGIQVADYTAKDAITNDLKLTPETVADYPALVGAMQRFLGVLILRDRVAGNVRATTPVWKHMLGDKQLAQLSVVEMSPTEFSSKVPAPTTQQVQEQFDKFRQVTSGTDHPANDPLGFGYGYPDRVKIQYLTVPHKSVVEAARAERKAYDLEVDARMYYYAHQNEFVRAPKPATQPATQPGTQPVASAASPTTLPTTGPTTGPTTEQAAAPATAPTTQPLAKTPVDPASTQPSTRPFVEVQNEIVDKILEKPATELEQKVVSAITARLESDFHSRPTTAPATGQATLPAGSGFESKEYLDGVALDIQKRFGVLPTVVQVGDWKSSQDLRLLPGLGMSYSTTLNKTFPEIAMPDAAAATAAPAERALPLPEFAPSPALKDFTENVYVFRISARSPAHAPELTDVKDLVAGDYITSQAYSKAVETAKKLADAASKQTLSAAALAAGVRPPFTTRALAPGQPISELAISRASQAQLGAKTVELLGMATPENPHPVMLVELPADRKVLVIQLAGVQSRVPADDQYMEQLVETRTAEDEGREQLVKDYFSADAIKARIGYRAEESASDRSGV